MRISELEKTLANIKSIYVSNDEFWRANDQSCDCLKIIVDTGDKMILLQHQELGEDGYIVYDEAPPFDEQKFKYKVDLENETFNLERVACFENEFVDAIKFVGNEVFLFIFASEDNLILTKSKFDILDETNAPFEKEAKLNIIECP